MTGREKEQLVNAIVSAYSEDDLRMLMQFELGVSLDAVVGPGPLGTRVFETVQYTERQGLTPELVAAVVRNRPHREDIQKAYRGYTTGVASATAAGPVSPEVVRDYAKVFGDQPAVAVQKGGGAEAVVTSVEAGLQRTIRDDLGFLPAANWSGLSDRMQRRVCRVELNDPKGGMGSGFLVGPDALLTAYHVLEPVIKAPGGAAAVRFRFDYQWRPDGSTADGVLVELAGAGGGPDPARPWLLSHAPYSAGEAAGTPDNPPPTAGELDFALVRLARPVGNDPSADGLPRGWIELPTNQPAVNGLQFLTILQHPARRPLELAFDTHPNARLLFGGLRLRYATNTEAGSSGSPVFDKYWKLVGLHHYGDPTYHHRPEYNQAVPIGLIRTALERTPVALAALGPDADALRRVKVLSAAATAVRAELATGAPTEEGIVTAAAQASAAAYVGVGLAKLSDKAREVIEREIQRAEEAWDEGMKSPSAGDKKKATDQFIYDLCQLLKIARQRNGGSLPPDWQQIWDDHRCS